MPEYLATYRVTAYEYGFGGSTPYETKKEARFSDADDEAARETARQKRFEMK